MRGKVAPSPTTLVLLGGAVVGGAALRLYHVGEQLLLSDEWHALHAAATESLTSLLALITIGATSIPMNVYTKLLLDTVGWSELALRLPCLIAGIGMLAVFPLLVRDLFSPRTTVLFAYLLAISPLLVFYSRYARPYAIVVLLTFVSLMACYRWAVSGRRVHGVVFVTAGVLAAYFHLTELRVLFVPLVLLIVLKAFRVPLQWTIRPSIAALIVAALVSALLLAVLYVPGFFFGRQQLTVVVGQSPPDLATLLAMSELMSGTSLPVVRAAFVALAALGLASLLRRDRLLAALLIAVVVGSVGMVFLTRPLGSHMPLVFTRYVIAILPVLLLAVASGADEVLGWAARRSSLNPRLTERVASGAVAVGVFGLFWYGPLPATYAGHNDVTNHKSFQRSYGHAAGASYDVAVSLRPAFYDRLGAEDGCRAIIEYPFLVGEPNSPYFLYQRRHRKRVLGGYVHIPARGASGEQSGIVGADWPIDDVLLEVGDRAKLRFRNLVDLGDPAAVRSADACYLIVHPHLEREMRGPGAAPLAGLARAPDFVSRFGQPIYADDLTTVFDLRRSAS